MENRKVEVRYDGRQARPWALYWSGTDELASEECFATLEEAGPVMRELLEEQEETEACAAR